MKNFSDKKVLLSIVIILLIVVMLYFATDRNLNESTNGLNSKNISIHTQNKKPTIEQSTSSNQEITKYENQTNDNLEIDYYDKYFTASPAKEGGAVYSTNVVGYINSKTFTVVVDMQYWLVDHWEINSPKGSDKVVISPRDKNDTGRDFSDINFSLIESDENNNALTLLETDLKNQDGINTIYQETIPNKYGNGVIYHIAKTIGDRTYNKFYIDGNGGTATIEFNSSAKNNSKYIDKVKEFLQKIMISELNR